VFSVTATVTAFLFQTAQQRTEHRAGGIDDFPTPEQLWEAYKKYKGIHNIGLLFERVTNQKPRYYQQVL
jgi:type I restriction enzyme R subunit